MARAYLLMEEKKPLPRLPAEGPAGTTVEASFARTASQECLVIRSLLFFCAMVALALLVAYRAIRRPHSGPLGDYSQGQALTLGAIAFAFLVIAVIMAVR